MSLTPPETVGKLQTALHTKAKAAPDYRFYALYDKLYRADVLRHAFHRCLANGGAAGVDGETFEQILEGDLDAWLAALAQELRDQTYQARAVRRVLIPKPDGKQSRPLGIPCIRDRIAQMAAVLVLEPIFEADLQPEQYGYRPNRGALDAVEEVEALIRAGYREVVDADLSGYFDSIPHAELMKSLSRRISDGRLLRLLKMWLEMAVEETDKRGNRRRTTHNKDEGRGTPQGAPISPLLSNIYMRRFLLGWKTQGRDRALKTRIVNYADDFVICCWTDAEPAMARLRRMMPRLKLTINETKTRKCRLPDESFDFLGYSFGRNYDRRTGRAYLGASPSRKKVQSLGRRISEQTSRRWLYLSEEEVVKQLNMQLIGWGNYFRIGTVSRAYAWINNHAVSRLRQWLCAKYDLRGQGYTRFPNRYLRQELGLVELRRVRASASP